MNKSTSSVTFYDNTINNKNPDGTEANIGVYGETYSWPVHTILNVETTTNSYNNLY